MSLEESLARRKTAGRNDPCPCGSGKKYKKCHHAEDEQAAHEDLASQRAAAEAAAAAAAEAEAEAEDAETGTKKSPAKGTGPRQSKGKPGSNRASGSQTGSATTRSASLPRRGAI